MYEYRCDERLKIQAEGSTLLGYTGFRGGLEFENAARALEEGHSNRARRLATAAFYERNINGQGALDLNRISPIERGSCV